MRKKIEFQLQKETHMDAFERARKVAIRVMQLPMWQKSIGEEDPLMVAHIPQLARINKLGMITINSQAGNVRHVKSLRTGKQATIAERAYCYGFVPADAADKILRWMWTHTDKYAVKVYIGDDEKLQDFGWFGVTTHDGGETWFTSVTPAVRPEIRNENYPPMGGMWEQWTREERARAHKAIGPYLESPIPESAVCLLFVDMTIGRLASAPSGLFSELERCLRRVSA